MVPWLAVDPDAQLTVAGGPRPVAQLLAELEPADRDGGAVVTDAQRWRVRDPEQGLMGPDPQT